MPSTGQKSLLKTNILLREPSDMGFRRRTVRRASRPVRRRRDCVAHGRKKRAMQSRPLSAYSANKYYARSKFYSL